MGKIITLKDKITQENIYPVTTITAVVMDNGENLLNYLESKIEEDLIELDGVVTRAESAIESINNLTNLPELPKDIINNLENIISDSKTRLAELETKYKDLNSLALRLVNKSDLTQEVTGETGKIPTGMAIRNYVSSASLNVLDYLINSTESNPNYVPTNSGQILVNENTNEVFIASGNSNKWLKFNATPLILDQPVINRSVNDYTLDMNGDVSVDDTTVVVPNTQKVEDDTLIL